MKLIIWLYLMTTFIEFYVSFEPNESIFRALARSLLWPLKLLIQIVKVGWDIITGK